VKRPKRGVFDSMVLAFLCPCEGFNMCFEKMQPILLIALIAPMSELPSQGSWLL
jgi:hypothetical protein